MSDPHIDIVGVNFQYGDIPILQNVNVQIPHNQLVLLIGPNGGGKTTLLKLILGLLTPVTGYVLIDNQLPKKRSHHIGYVPQSLQFDRQFPLSVLEFVLFGALHRLTWYGTYPKSVQERAKDLIEQVGMQEFIHAPFGTLSGGQRQRVSIARALMSHPDLLILDEPTTGLDPLSAHQIQEMFTQFKGEKTILCVTHTADWATETVDKLLVVHKTVECMDPKSSCEHYRKGWYHPPGSSTKEGI